MASDGMPGREMDPGVDVRERAGSDDLPVAPAASAETGTGDGARGGEAVVGTGDTEPAATRDGEQPANRLAAGSGRRRQAGGSLCELAARNRLFCAALMHALLRRYVVPRRVATLATTPVLFDPRELLVEHRRHAG